MTFGWCVYRRQSICLRATQFTLLQALSLAHPHARNHGAPRLDRQSIRRGPPGTANTGVLEVAMVLSLCSATPNLSVNGLRAALFTRVSPSKRWKAPEHLLFLAACF